MKTLVIYDVSEDDVRNNIANICSSFGLTRIQKSAFIGYLPSSARKELVVALKKAISGASANVQVFIFCNYCSMYREVLGKGDLESVPERVIVR
ncbi:MAG: CRISPR-associated endonuclease Cas2 [Nitrososphaerota archaeon]